MDPMRVLGWYCSVFVLRLCIFVSDMFLGRSSHMLSAVVYLFIGTNTIATILLATDRPRIKNPVLRTILWIVKVALALVLADTIFAGLVVLDGGIAKADFSMGRMATYLAANTVYAIAITRPYWCRPAQAGRNNFTNVADVMNFVEQSFADIPEELYNMQIRSSLPQGPGGGGDQGGRPDAEGGPTLRHGTGSPGSSLRGGGEEGGIFGRAAPYVTAAARKTEPDHGFERDSGI